MRILAAVLILAALVAAESSKNSSASNGTASSAIVPSGAVPPTAAQNRAVRVEGEKTLSHELRTLPHASAQISTENDGNYRSSHASASAHHG